MSAFFHNIIGNLRSTAASTLQYISKLRYYSTEQYCIAKVCIASEGLQKLDKLLNYTRIILCIEYTRRCFHSMRSAVVITYKFSIVYWAPGMWMGYGTRFYVKSSSSSFTYSFVCTMTFASLV